MKYVTHNEKDNIGIGGHLQGYVDANYNVLVKLFGKPSDWFDDYKSDAEWIIEFEDGVKCCIYNWKDGKNYLGDEDGLEVHEIRDWHIGSTDADNKCVDRIHNLVRDEQRKFDQYMESVKKDTLEDLQGKLIDCETDATDYANTLHGDDVELMQTLSEYVIAIEKADKLKKEITLIKNSTLDSLYYKWEGEDE